MKFLKVWGCLAKVGLPQFRRTNVGPKTFDCVFVGYALNNAAYRFMSLSDNSVCESRDVEFFVHIFPLKKNDVNDVASPTNVIMSPSLPATSLGYNEHEMNLGGAKGEE